MSFRTRPLVTLALYAASVLGWLLLTVVSALLWWLAVAR